MCGRFTQYCDIDRLVERFIIDPVRCPWPARYNIAPMQEVACIVADGNRRHLRAMRWGLVPPWTEDPLIGRRMINARAATLAEKPAYKHAFQQRRCLVPADGFYEWRNDPGGKMPMYIRRADKQPLAMAGLWEHRPDPGGSTLETFTIITTPPNALIQPIHSRMPAILQPDDEATWLNTDVRDVEPLQAMLRPIEAEALTAHAVSRRVNNPAHDEPLCIAEANDEGLFDR